MRLISFYLFYSFLWLLTQLPLKFLYGFSSVIFFLVYHLFPYRKKLVHQNLKNSFPEYDTEKLKAVKKKFYYFFADSLIESAVTGFISEKEIRKRFVVKNPERCNDLYEKGKSITLLMSHYGNWEWSAITPRYLKHKVLPIYKPLHNPYFDRMIKKSRERFGAETIPMDKIMRTLTGYKKKGIPTLTFFIADQRPRWAQIQYWTTFLNQDTPVILGPEKIARKMDHAVLFLKITPVKRGHYEAEYITLFEDTGEAGPYEITDSYLALLENTIREKPEYWLWTHDRWKHEKEKFVQKARPVQ